MRGFQPAIMEGTGGLRKPRIGAALQRHGCAYTLAPGAPGETRFDIWFPVR